MIQLSKLQFNTDGLEPHISAESIETHRVHQATYVKNLSQLIKGTEYETSPLETIIRKSKGPIYNNASQIWNHAFYFDGLAPPDGDNAPTDEVAEYLTEHFGSPEKFMKEFTAACKKTFGSGWVYLMHHSDGNARIHTFPNAEGPFNYNKPVPLLCWDVWEHNYYQQFQYNRVEAIDAFWKVVSWETVTKRLSDI